MVKTQDFPQQTNPMKYRCFMLFQSPSFFRFFHGPPNIGGPTWQVVGIAGASATSGHTLRLILTSWNERRDGIDSLWEFVTYIWTSWYLMGFFSGI